MTIYLSVSAIADALAVKQQTVLGWIKAGDLAACNVGRTATARKPRWRISQAALDQFLAGRQTQRPQPATRRRKKDSADVIQFFT